MTDLFAADNRAAGRESLPAGVTFRPGLLDSATQTALAAAVDEIAAGAPFRHPRTRGQGMFSAAITNCGTVGWWSDRRGYRYLSTQPESDLPWPAMPRIFRETAAKIVDGTSWPRFEPDACLINFYDAGAKMGLHQDRDERDFAQPIITVSLGDTADFMVGGATRSQRPQVFPFRSGDVLIMGGEGRMLFHGVRRIHGGTSPIPGLQGRYSLTFRKAL